MPIGVVGTRLRGAAVRGWLARLLPLTTLALLACGATPDFEPAPVAPPTEPPSYTLQELSERESFNQLAFRGSPVGFAYLRLEPLADRQYRLYSQAFMNLNLLGARRISVVNAISTVDHGLGLKQFDYRYWVDGVESHITGSVEGLKLHADVTRNGRHHTHEMELKRRVLPSVALNLYPVFKGLEVGRQYNFSYLDGETLRIKVVQQSIEAFETSEELEEDAYRILSNIQGHRVVTWMSPQAVPLLESSTGNMFTARATSIEPARLAVVDAVLDKQASHEALARVPTTGNIQDPNSVGAISIALTGLPRPQAVPSNLLQYCDGTTTALLCETSTPRMLASDIEAAGMGDYLLASSTVPVDTEAVGSAVAQLDAEGLAAADTVAGIVDWMQTHIEPASDAPASVETVLTEGRGGTRMRALTYAALARRLEIPTRVVHGIVYSTEHARFVFHSWAESWFDGIWNRVDPAQAQTPADGTHIALVEGETEAAAASLLPLMGRLSVEVLTVY